MFSIKVIENPVIVKDTAEESWKTVPEFNITVNKSSDTICIIRYIPDLLSFNHLVETHYPKIKIRFPVLTESIELSKSEKRKSLRNFFHKPTKSNAEKVEKYLYRCSMDPVLKHSTLLRDFFSPQRDGDTIKRNDTNMSHDCPSPVPSSFAIVSHNTMPTTTTAADGKQGSIWVPSPLPSSISLSRHSSSIVSLHSSGIDRDTSMNNVRDELKDECEEKEDDCSLNSFQQQTDHHSQKSEYLEQQDGYNFPLDNLEIIKVLGKGCMGKVLLVRSKNTRELFALKSILKEHVIEQREITHTLGERNILTRLAEMGHPYLVKLHASFQDEYRLYLLTSYHSGGDLATHMARLYYFPKDCALFYAAEIVDGIGELHRLGILYRDLKPENILLSGDGHIVLTDFGLSKCLTEEEEYRTQTFCGTAEYLAPEVLLGEAYSFGIDYWSFGTILYEMLAGVTPFWADNHADMYKRVLEDPLEFPADLFDYETAEFLSDLLDRDPRTRLGVNGIDEIKNHIYFADIDWDDIRNRKLQPPYLPPGSNELDFTNFDPDFLSMSPNLTPISSEADFILTDEIQDIFDGYSFTNESFFLKNHSQQEQKSDDYPQEIMRDDDDNEHEKNQGEYNISLFSFQPARKRGSISMLSNVESFCLDQPDRFNNCDSTAVKANSSLTALHNNNTKDDDEHIRYAKRRNTSASIEEHNYPTSISNTHFYVEDSIPKASNMATVANNKPTLVVINSSNDNLLLTPSSSQQDGTDATFVDDLQFSKLPDLRLSFKIDAQGRPYSNKQPQHQTTTNNSKKSKTRKFFSLLL